jgi:hypothetical protein
VWGGVEEEAGDRSAGDRDSGGYAEVAAVEGGGVGEEEEDTVGEMCGGLTDEQRYLMAMCVCVCVCVCVGRETGIIYICLYL